MNGELRREVWRQDADPRDEKIRELRALLDDVTKRWGRAHRDRCEVRTELGKVASQRDEAAAKLADRDEKIAELEAQARDDADATERLCGQMNRIHAEDRAEVGRLRTQLAERQRMVVALLFKHGATELTDADMSGMPDSATVEVVASHDSLRLTDWLHMRVAEPSEPAEQTTVSEESILAEAAEVAREQGNDDRADWFDLAREDHGKGYQCGRGDCKAVKVARQVLAEIEPSDTPSPSPQDVQSEPANQTAPKPRQWKYGDQEPHDRPAVVDSSTGREWQWSIGSWMWSTADHTERDRAWLELVELHGPLTEVIEPPQPKVGQRVRVVCEDGLQSEDVVRPSGYYAGAFAVERGEATVEVIGEARDA